MRLGVRGGCRHARRQGIRVGGHDATERPPEPPQGENLFLLIVSQRPGALLPHWLVFRCPRLTGFGCPPRRSVEWQVRTAPAGVVKRAGGSLPALGARHSAGYRGAQSRDTDTRPKEGTGNHESDERHDANHQGAIRSDGDRRQQNLAG